MTLSGDKLRNDISIFSDSWIHYLLFHAVKIAKRLFTQSRPKTHDFTQYRCDSEFVFEPLGTDQCGYMTAQKKGVKVGDFIVFLWKGEHRQYRVEQIEYYSLSDMWIALLSN